MSVAVPRDNSRKRNGPLSGPSSTSPAPTHHLPAYKASLPPAAGSYLTVNNTDFIKTQSFLNLTTSALSGVFGSQVSLSELAGDDAGQRSGTEPEGAAATGSRFGKPPKIGHTRKSASIDDYDDFLKDANKSLHRAFTEPVARRRRGSMPFYNLDASSVQGRKILARRTSLPALTPSQVPVRLSITNLLIRLVTLFAFGIAYGELARNLHDNHQVPSGTLDISVSQNTAVYSLVWGAQGIFLGFMLPLFDWLFPGSTDFRASFESKGGNDWSSIIRAVSAFMGLGLGVRKLPWDSSAQVAALWGLVNPFLWYMFDGTRNGLLLSCATAVFGTIVFAVAFPSHLPEAGLSSIYMAVAGWVASVYFCCSICFGNIGRRILTFDVSSITRP